MPSVQRLSFSAIGIPVSGAALPASMRFWAASAFFIASSSVTVMYERTFPSFFFISERNSEAASLALISLESSIPRSFAAVIFFRSMLSLRYSIIFGTT